MATDNSGIQTLTSSHRSGSIFPVGSTPVVYTSTDATGNKEMQTFVVIVKGKEPSFNILFHLRQQYLFLFKYNIDISWVLGVLLKVKHGTLF